MRSNVQSPVHAKLRLETPQGWKVEPAEIAVELDHDGDLNNYTFQITPQNLHEGTYKVTARAEYNGKQYAEGFKIITRPDLDSYYAYRPATENVQAVDVKLPPQLKVGYIMGAGDEIPSVLAKRRPEHQHHHAARAGLWRSQPLWHHRRRHSRL